MKKIPQRNKDDLIKDLKARVKTLEREKIPPRRCHLCDEIEVDKWCVNKSCYEYTRYEQC